MYKYIYMHVYIYIYIPTYSYTYIYIYVDMYKSSKIKVDLYSFCCRNARQRAARIHRAHGLRAHVAEKEKK